MDVVSKYICLSSCDKCLVNSGYTSVFKQILIYLEMFEPKSM